MLPSKSKPTLHEIGRLVDLLDHGPCGSNARVTQNNFPKGVLLATLLRSGWCVFKYTTSCTWGDGQS